MWETLLFKTKLLLCGWRVLLHCSEPTSRQTQAHRCRRAKWQMGHKGLLLCPVWKASLRPCSHPKALDIHASPGKQVVWILDKGWSEYSLLYKGSAWDSPKMWIQSVTESDRIPHVSTRIQNGLRLMWLYLHTGALLISLTLLHQPRVSFCDRQHGHKQLFHAVLCAHADLSKEAK